jgi:type IV secretion system protein TrbL
MTLYFLIGAGFNLSQNWIALAAQAPVSQAGVTACWIIGVGAVIYAMICWRGPAVAAGILGGGPNLSHNDIWGAISVAAQAGVSAALIASGIGSAAGAGVAAGGGAAASGASMNAGATAPSAANGASATAGSHARASGASQAAAALQAASSKGNGDNGSGGGAEFGGLDS